MLPSADFFLISTTKAWAKLPSRARSVQTALDHTQTKSAQARARAAVKTDDDILTALITIPRKLDCITFKP